MKADTKGKTLDKHTKKYIARIRLVQSVVLAVSILFFILFAYAIVFNNRNNLKDVAVIEVQESMRENVNNITIHIDFIRERIQKEGMADILDLQERIQSGGADSAEDIREYLLTCGENELGQAIEAIYTAADGEKQYIKKQERDIIPVKSRIPAAYTAVAALTTFAVNGQECSLFIAQSEIDRFAKEEIAAYLHSEIYDGNQYVWVNEILRIEGGQNYAIRKIHPNLPESEGRYLSTTMQDEKGNYPYETELEGIREKGWVFHSYYFKNKVNDEVTEKFSYAQYYEPFNWIIATGETLEEVFAYSEEVNTRSVHQIMLLMIMFVGLFVMMSGFMIRVLTKQAQVFREILVKQTEVFEDIYNTMSMGLARLYMTETETAIIKINPMGLQLLGVETEEEYLEKITGHIIKTMDAEDAQKLEESCRNLKEQWESSVIECWVTWKDNSRHLLRIRNTLIEFEEDTKIIQRMCQDITEERRQQEAALHEAEEKATLDPMTQIKNKKAIEAIIRAEIAEAAEKNLAIAVGFVDIDNFREYNTLYGHLQGDEVIKYVAAVLKGVIPGTVGRNGGDEFAFVMQDTSFAEVETCMQLIHKRLNEGIIVRETSEKISTPCSIGVLLERKDTLTYDYVMKYSDVAMYAAKAAGKNTYHILDNT